MLTGFDVWCQTFEHLARIADKSGVDLHVLVDFGAINLNVDLAGALGVRPEVAGDAVVEAHADCNEEVGFLNRIVHPGLAVHTHHAEIEGITGREAADAEKCHRNRIIAGADEFFKDTHSAGNHDAVARQNNGTLGGIEHLDSTIELSLIVIIADALWWKFWGCRFPVELRGSLLSVFGNVN